MSTLKAPFYRIYFYIVILFLVSTVVASTGFMSDFDFSKYYSNEKIELYSNNGSIVSGRFFVPPSYTADSSEHIAFTQTCFQADDSTQFFAITDNKDIIRYSWDFGVAGIDYDTSDQKNPSYFYPSAGDYRVTLKYFTSPTDSFSVDSLVKISADITAPDLGKDIEICPEQFPYLLNAYQSGAPAGATYIWSTGETTASIQAKKPGNYWVAVTVGSCTKMEEVEVTEYGKERKRAARWHFGNKAGINFQTQQPNDSAKLLNSPEGSATMSDINGDLLFYTDGQTIYNKNHEPLKNGDSIGGSPNSTQSSIIMPWPSREPYYFVFTTDAINSSENSLSVTLVDLKGDNAEGEVLYKNNLVYQPVTEKLTAFSLRDGDNVDSIIWLVTQEANTGAFKVFKIDSNGINEPPQTFDFGKPTTASSSEGQMKISITGTSFAVAMGDKVDVYNFDDSTGTISEPVTIDLPEGGAYGLEFSPDGSKVYVTNSKGLYQIDIADSTGTRLPNDSIRLPKHTSLISEGNYGALQIGADYRIYVATPGANSLGVINNPDVEETVVQFNPTGYQLAAGTTSTRGLPNFVQNFLEPPQGPGLGASDVCGPDIVQLFGSGWGDRDDFKWTIKDSISGQVILSTGFERMKTMVEQYFAVGLYSVVLEVKGPCVGMDTILRMPLLIESGPDKINLGDDFTLCPGQTRTLTAGRVQPGVTYLWSTGSTNPSITINTYGTYTVVATKENGCAEFDQIVVSPPVFGEIVGDTTLCSGETTQLSTTSAGYQHRWYNPSNALISSNSYINVNLPGKYRVEVTDPASGCSDKDEVTIVVSNQPVVTPTIAAYPKCNDKNGVIVLSNPAEPNYKYQWFNQDNTARPTDTTETLSHVGPGIYRARVTHPGGCERWYSVSLNPDNVQLNFALTTSVNCNVNGPATATVQFTVSNYPTPLPAAQNFVLRIFDQNTNQQVGAALNFNTATSPSRILEEGAYYATLTDPNRGNCVYRVSDILIDVPVVSKPTFDDLGPMVYSCVNQPVRIFNGNATSYTWQAYSDKWAALPAASSFTTLQPGNPGITATFPNLPGETKRYFVVTAVSASGCRKIDTAAVTFVNYIASLPIIPPRCNSQGPVTIAATFSPAISATVAKNFQYVWKDNGATINANSPSITISSIGTHNLSLQFTDNRLGNSCIKPAVTTSVVINQSPTDGLGADIAATECPGTPITVQATRAGAYPAGSTYKWSSPNITIPPGSVSAPAITVTQPAILWLDVTSGVCTDRYDIKINYLTPPPSSLTDAKFCPKRSKSVTLTAGPEGYNYTWTDSATKAVVGNDFELTVSKAGTYIVSIVDENGCETIAKSKVISECEGEILVADAFTPNGDSHNDLLKFYGADISSFTVSIYNRWGQLIYNNTNQGVGWDGRTSGGKDAPSGTYVYVLRYKSSKGDANRIMTQKGSVVLIR